MLDPKILDVDIERAADLNAIGVDEGKARKAAVVLGRHFRSDPAAQRAAYDGNVVQIELLDKIEHDVGEVIGAGQPIRPPRDAKARRRGHDHLVIFGKLSDEGAVDFELLFARQQEQRRTAPVSANLYVYPAHGDDVLMKRVLEHGSPTFFWFCS